MARNRHRRSWTGATDEAQNATGAPRGGTYYRAQEPPAVRDPKAHTQNLRDITQWASREFRRVQNEALVGLEDYIALQAYDAEPGRAAVSHIHGGVLNLVDAGAVSSGAVLSFNQGIGKMFFVVNAATDFAGTLNVTGTSVDRNTGSATAYTATITVDALTTDNSYSDSNSNAVYGFVGAYITDRWFYGTVSVSTADLDIQDIDVWHVSFEQFNDSPDVWLTTFDANLLATNVAAKFDAYLYTVQVTGDKVDISAVSTLNLGTPVANRYYRLRRGFIDKYLNGSTDGVFVDAHYANSPAYIEDVTIKVWGAKAV